MEIIQAEQKEKRIKIGKIKIKLYMELIYAIRDAVRTIKLIQRNNNLKSSKEPKYNES